VYRPAVGAIVLAAIFSTLAVPSIGAAQDRQATPPTGAPASDLDAFMEKVLARREVNRKTLNEYVLDETESFEILGPGRMRIHRTKRDFTWYVRDGMHVRSPVRFEGVTVGAAARDEYERNWIARERRRQERKAKNEREKGEVSIGPDGVQVSGVGASMPTEPRFVSEAYFMDFKFEPGNYFLAGREPLDGIDVLRIEYYPKRLFADDDKRAPDEMKRQSREGRREKELEDEIERRMNRTSLVTLWVDPATHQIVKYTFDNVWLDFLPGAWLVRVDDMRASMTMSQPFPGVWLPRDIRIHAGVTLASGSFEAGYNRTFDQYREAQVKTSIKVKAPDEQPEAPDPAPVEAPVFDAEAPTHGPAVLPDVQQEIVREVRIHGNAFLADDEVLKLARVAVGAPLDADGIAAIERRLKDSGRFETVEVRKRYRSLTDPTDVALVLLVHERPGIRTAADRDVPALRPWRRFTSGLMFLPILSYADGYGFTYGARVSAVDTLGIGERLSVPLTWGGTRRAALEFERTFERGPLTRLSSSVGIWQRENPRFEIDDQRVELKAGVERQFAHVVRLGAEATRSTVEFGDLDDRLWTFGTTAALDTRGDPAFPGNAVYLGAGWTALNVEGLPQTNRYTLDGRGYLRLFGQPVLAGRAQYYTSDAPLPIYERLLLGGASSLRGFGTGSFDGDRMLVTSAEVRVPLTSVIRGAKLGMTVFADAGKVADYGTSLDDARWERSAGGGLFLIASILRINVDVAKSLDGGGTRVHLASGFAF
jgi:hypothetical protein